MVFSNQPEVELFINGISQGKQQADAYATFQWKSIQLTEGENKIEVKAGKKKDQVTDSVIWHL
ncbi:glycosyl hydrolase family 2 sugar binding domain protein [Parabacteroides sp. CAG:409]|nr:glycosyl hydrolase family 2 sugar binding domain protein [Parabacteroides sp. CAG:409]